MLRQAIGDLLPVAFAVALSPIPIVAVVLVLGGPKARRNGPAFAVGWVAGLSAVSTLIVLLTGNASEPESDVAVGVNWLMAGIGVLFVLMAAGQWKKRPKSGQKPQLPQWMATIESISSMKALLVGLALSAANPKNLALTFAASVSIAEAGLDGTDSAVAVATFVLIGSASVLGAVVCYLVVPGKAERPLAAVKQFMAANNATIMMVILLLLGAKILGDAVGGVWS